MNTLLDELIEINNKNIEVLTGIARDLLDWQEAMHSIANACKPHTHYITRGKNKGKCKDCGEDLSI